VNADDVGIYGCGIYTQPNEVQPKNQCRALHNYEARRADELTFHAGDVITNVITNNAGW